MINITVNDGQGGSKDYIIRWEKNPNGTTSVYKIEKEFYSMKHIATAIQCIADDTGYDYDFLAGVVDDAVREDGMTYEEAIKEVRGIAEEQDF